jgi:hypothetical protein
MSFFQLRNLPGYTSPALGDASSGKFQSIVCALEQPAESGR